MNNKIVFFVVVSFLLFMISLSPAHAQVDLGDFDFFKRFSSIGALVSVLLPNVLIFAGIILLVYTVMAGFNMIRSAGSGDAEAATKARQTLTYGIMGFVIVFTAALVMQLVEFLTGVPIFNPGF